ncbi:hypothetical protein BO82DRAFT_431525 [Aspergillus uvarum CBS 121591]|uniref:Alpha-1,3-glucanase/mutanase n=1 Tax=Aspergillus uvarum CBS 121591 TaxID=1448315 RepID=A0A319CH29_9EURO|nr:hypothetical protein BO82DRAFT_431525 [Aspergillus uvarum CBS 121591]PYH82597.1 hypothetical protein BO82DRAFT_431525 [Aspergillus uvarum CBS 121591]
MSIFEWLLCLMAMSAHIVTTTGRAVFAHYMVGNITTDHVHQDVDDAVAMGLDGYALNVQCPTDSWANNLVLEMGNYIRNQHYDFGIFISMDVYASGGPSCGQGPAGYVDLCVNAMGYDAYYKVNDKYMVSTYSFGGGTWDTWSAFKLSVKNSGDYDVYWIPDLGDTEGYWSSDAGWWYYWGNLTDGLFSWESAWPALGQDAADQSGGVGGVARDQVIIDKAAETEGASYMIRGPELDAYSANVYRQGETNFMQRLHDILEIESDALEFVEYITWNGEDAVGAIWYHTLALDDTCPFEGIGEYTFWDKPAGYQTFSLTTHWAVVLDDTVGGYAPSDLELMITTATDDQVVVTDLSAGLNFAQGPNINAGYSVSMVLAPKTGTTVLYSASGGKCPASSCTEGFYNLDYQILPLVPGDGGSGCTYEETVLRYTPLNTTADDTIDCKGLLTLTDTAVTSWEVSQAGLAVEFETTRHALSTSHGVTGCSDITNDNACKLPDTCPVSNDQVPYFFAQRAFSIFQRCLREMSTSVFEDGFITSLGINDMVDDVTTYLTPKSDEADLVKIMGAMAAGVTILSGGLGPISTFASSLSALLGGVFSMISVLDSPSDPADSNAFLAEPGTALSDRLSVVVQQYNTSLVNLAQAVFETGDLSSFPDYALDTSADLYGKYSTTDMAKFFAGGRFADPDMACGNVSTGLMAAMQQSLVGYMLASSNVYIIPNGDSIDNCPGSRGTVLNLDSAGSVCYTLEQPGLGSYYADLSDPLSADSFDVLYDKYKINLPALVSSSLQCQTAQGYNGAYSPSTSIIPGSGYAIDNLPPCFFNLPVLYTDYTVKTTAELVTISGTPCQLREGTEADGAGYYLLPSLAKVFTAHFCLHKPGH